MAEPNGNGVGLSLRELVLEVRDDVKDLKENSVSKAAFVVQDQRIHDLEESKLILRGAWLSLGVAVSVVAGLAGLFIASLAYF